MGFYISGIEYYLPERIIDNDYLSRESGIDPEFLETKVGIRERRIADENETTADMAVAAATKLITGMKLRAEDIDLLLVCTQTPDFSIPGVASLVHHRLDLKKSCFSFDVGLGCSGYVHSLAIAGNFVKTGSARRALLLTSDQYSKVIDYKDRATASIFGDGATASLLESCGDDEGYLAGEFGTDGARADRLILPNSGVVKNSEAGNCLFMDGREIFKFAVHTVPESVELLLGRTSVARDQIKYFIFHQANKYILLELKQRIGLSDEQVVIDMEYIGNTVSSTIPIAFKNLCSNGLVKDQDLLVLSGFGVGLSWGTVLYRHKAGTQ